MLHSWQGKGRSPLSGDVASFGSFLGELQSVDKKLLKTIFSSSFAVMGGLISFFFFRIFFGEDF